ncbi:hypothetical protein [Congregicoccus parvus]|uniref:hypothetical protein n=1 Tax=Congregicoccus parvus TaxID=3081749 RepID=UPI003FA5CC79
MSLLEIEAELAKLTPEELRRLALRSWSAYVQREEQGDAVQECSEDDPKLLAALDEAIARADKEPGIGHSGREVRAHLRRWTSR